MNNATSSGAGNVNRDEHVSTGRPGASAAADPRDEATRIVKLASSRDVAVRVMGGVAVGLCCPSAQSPPLARSYRDIDFAARSDQGREVAALFESAGYEADAEFNALHGRHRMFFWDPVNRREADVFLDRFAMCHTFDFRARLGLTSPTLPIADLLLFKLQVVETNDKDYQDATALLADQPATPDGLDPEGVARFLAGDWGWWRTVTRVLDSVEEYARELPGFAGSVRVSDNILALRAAIEAHPKSTRWRMRAKVGEKRRWYETPEDAHATGPQD
ncbi:MAG: hypothetical protein ACJ780_00380 [Solirubrobacteraceae bacterium]